MNKSLLIQDTKVIICNSESKNKNDNHLIIFLHGFGANAEDLTFFNNTNVFDNTFNIYPEGFIQLNNQFSKNSYCWGDFSHNEYQNQMRASALKLNKIINKIKIDFFDNQSIKISIVGFSQGGMLAQLMAFTELNNIENLILLSTMLPDFNEIKIKTNINNIFVGHGIYDEVIQISNADLMYDFYNNHGYNIKYKKYNTSHSIDNTLLDDISVYKFY